MRAKVRELPVETIRHAHVVGVHSSDVSARRGAAASVQGLDEAAVCGLTFHDNASVTACERSEDLVCAIPRSVVDNNEFKIRKRLAQNALNRFADELLAVVH